MCCLSGVAHQSLRKSSSFGQNILCRSADSYSLKLHLSPKVESALRKAIYQDDVEGLGRLASPLNWGRPSWSASHLLVEVNDGNPKKLRFWARALSAHNDPYVRRYAPILFLNLWRDDRERSKRVLTALANDQHWLVREVAHGVWGELLKLHFKEISQMFRKWNNHPSANLRRCVVHAVRDAGNLRKKEWAETLVHLLEPLLCDKTNYVRKNLGPYAIGDGLLRCYPALAIKHLRRWAQRTDEATRWNVAMSFASYGGNKNWRIGLSILTQLATDERRYVWRSVASAMLYLARRHPEVRSTLNNWLSDSKRAKAAEIALRYLRT